MRVLAPCTTRLKAVETAAPQHVVLLAQAYEDDVAAMRPDLPACFEADVAVGPEPTRNPYFWAVPENVQVRARKERFASRTAPAGRVTRKPAIQLFGGVEHETRRKRQQAHTNVCRVLFSLVNAEAIPALARLYRTEESYFASFVGTWVRQAQQVRTRHT